jgi:hypothetical protein
MNQTTFETIYIFVANFHKDELKIYYRRSLVDLRLRQEDKKIPFMMFMTNNKNV